MHSHRFAASLPLLGLALLAACDQSTDPGGAPLTPEEVRAIALVVDDLSSSRVDANAGGASFALSPSAAAAEPITRTTEFTTSIPCPRGGSVAVEGRSTLTADGEAGRLALEVEASQSHTACSFVTSQGIDVALDGTVSLSAERVASRDGTASGSQTHTGTLRYTTSSDKQGSCEIDLTSSFRLDAGAGTAWRTVQGSVCGRTVDATTRWERPQT